MSQNQRLPKQSDREVVDEIIEARRQRSQAMSQNPVGPEGAVIKTENEQCLDLVDWEQNCIMIGVTPTGDVPAPWEVGTEEDFRLLAALLLKPLTLVTAEGGIVQSPPLALHSEFLRKLGKTAEALARFESLRSRRSGQS